MKSNDTKDEAGGGTNNEAKPSKLPPSVLAARSELKNNWNPFSTAPRLDAAAFATTLIAISTLEFAVGFLIKDPLQSARLSVDMKQLLVLYGVWFFFSLIGFLLITNTFIKRWATIFGMPQSSRWMKLVGRFFLLSPLLSIWATITTVMYAREGALFRDGEKRSVVVATAVGTLILFHIVFLGWRMTQAQIEMHHGYFVLTQDVPMRDSFRGVVPGSREKFWLPGEAFHIHVYPYLSPVLKLAVSVYGDFARTNALEAAVARDPETYCVDVPTYVGQPVPDCFFAKYREMGARRAFVTPAFGLIYETLYRQKVMTDHKQAKSPMDAFALSAVSVDNLVTLLEPSDLVYDRAQFLHPIGLLAVFGSPELPAVAVGQDLQHLALNAKLLPLLIPQMNGLVKGVAEMKGALTPKEESDTNAKIASLSARIKALESDPLALHSAGSPRSSVPTK